MLASKGVSYSYTVFGLVAKATTKNKYFWLFSNGYAIVAISISMVLSSLAIISLLIAGKVHSLAFLFSIAYVLNVYSYMSAPAFMDTNVFGKKESDVIPGTISLLFALGFVFGSSLFGMIVDHFGFNAGWIIMLGCVWIGYDLLPISIKSVKEQNKKLINKINCY